MAEPNPEFLAVTVRDGRAGTPMPAFGPAGMNFTNQQIADIVAYVRTLAARSGK